MGLALPLFTSLLLRRFCECILVATFYSLRFVLAFSCIFAPTRRVGLFVGLVLSSIFLSIIEGSVSAILVCYASAPVDFHAKHPLLSAELKSVWKEFWLNTRV